jgi:hypothetical protein
MHSKLSPIQVFFLYLIYSEHTQIRQGCYYDGGGNKSPILWDSELQRVPGSFASFEEYVGVFEPLLFEECRAQLHNSWEELVEGSSGDPFVPVSVKTVERRERGKVAKISTTFL